MIFTKYLFIFLVLHFEVLSCMEVSEFNEETEDVAKKLEIADDVEVDGTAPEDVALDVSEDIDVANDVPEDLGITENVPQDADTAKDMLEDVATVENLPKELEISEGLQDDMKLPDDPRNELETAEDVLISEFKEEETEDVAKMLEIADDVEVDDTVPEYVAQDASEDVNIAENTPEDIAEDVPEDVDIANNVPEDLGIAENVPQDADTAKDMLEDVATVENVPKELEISEDLQDDMKLPDDPRNELETAENVLNDEEIAEDVAQDTEIPNDEPEGGEVPEDEQKNAETFDDESKDAELSMEVPKNEEILDNSQQEAWQADDTRIDEAISENTKYLEFSDEGFGSWFPREDIPEPTPQPLESPNLPEPTPVSDSSPIILTEKSGDKGESSIPHSVQEIPSPKGKRTKLCQITRFESIVRSVIETKENSKKKSLSFVSDQTPSEASNKFKEAGKKVIRLGEVDTSSIPKTFGEVGKKARRQRQNMKNNSGKSLGVEKSPTQAIIDSNESEGLDKNRREQHGENVSGDIIDTRRPEAIERNANQAFLELFGNRRRENQATSTKLHERSVSQSFSEVESEESNISQCEEVDTATVLKKFGVVGIAARKWHDSLKQDKEKSISKEKSITPFGPFIKSSTFAHKPPFLNPDLPRQSLNINIDSFHSPRELRQENVSWNNDRALLIAREGFVNTVTERCPYKPILRYGPLESITIVKEYEALVAYIAHNKVLYQERIHRVQKKFMEFDDRREWYAMEVKRREVDVEMDPNEPLGFRLRTIMQIVNDANLVKHRISPDVLKEMLAPEKVEEHMKSIGINLPNGKVAKMRRMFQDLKKDRFPWLFFIVCDNRNAPVMETAVLDIIGLAGS